MTKSTKSLDKAEAFEALKELRGTRPAASNERKPREHDASGNLVSGSASFNRDDEVIQKTTNGVRIQKRSI